MKKIKFLDISFENEINPWEVEAFRGAVVATAGRDHILFHNHKKEGFRYSYPLIQYKRIGKKPHIICIDEGVDEVHYFFENKQEGLMLGNRHYNLVVENINLNKFNLQVWDRSFNYVIYDWFPLNQKNFNEFKTIVSEIQQFEFLEKILIGNILSFAKGIGWNIDKQIELKITEILRTNIISLKGTKRGAYTLNFKCNVFLPNYIGLGKNASLGFGWVRENRRNKSEM
ncbi:MAG: hypothetical protein L3J54_09240 [Draconibacterium sp.]|nr:hypothetical protein [Draconibacterium sp.]